MLLWGGKDTTVQSSFFFPSPRPSLSFSRCLGACAPKNPSLCWIEVLFRAGRDHCPERVGHTHSLEWRPLNRARVWGSRGLAPEQRDLKSSKRKGRENCSDLKSPTGNSCPFPLLKEHFHPCNLLQIKRNHKE